MIVSLYNYPTFGHTEVTMQIGERLTIVSEYVTHNVSPLALFSPGQTKLLMIAHFLQQRWWFYDGKVNNHRTWELHSHQLHCQGHTQVRYTLTKKKCIMCLGAVCMCACLCMCETRGVMLAWKEGRGVPWRVGVVSVSVNFTSVETDVWNKTSVLSSGTSASASCTFRTPPVGNVLCYCYSGFSSPKNNMMMFFFLFFCLHDNTLFWCPTHLLWMSHASSAVCSGGCSQASAGTKPWSSSCNPITRMDPSWSVSQRQSEVRGFLSLRQK